MKELIKNFSIVAVFLLAVIAIAALTNLILKKPHFTANDLHIMWLLQGKDHFVVPDTIYAKRRDLLETNPQLSKLDNFRERFSRKKETGTFRVFCIGGSTTRGWPFQPVISYPKLLSLYLRDLLPGVKVEIINAGFHRSDSFSDTALIRELVGYEPDLILLYEGRNEDIDASLYASRKLWLVKTHIWLLKNVYLYGYFNAVFDREFNAGRMLRELAGKKELGNDALRKMFDENLENILNITEQSNCGLALLTQVVHPEEKQGNGRVGLYNKWLREFGEHNKLTVIGIDKAFELSAMPTDELLIPPPSVHPDYKGYALMARTICRELSGNDIIASRKLWRWDRLKNDAYYFRKAGLNSYFLSNKYLKLSALFDKLEADAASQKYKEKAGKVSENGEPFINP